MDLGFKYNTAFSRNIGWLAENEQAQIRQKKIAIAGLGGVGGMHLLTLARLGFEHFHLAEFDRFDLVNFNRQVGATMSTLDQPKLDVMVDMAKGINPSMEIYHFPEGVTTENVDAFLSGVDLYIDGVDAFAMETRCLIFARCARFGIPAITAAPLGMGTAYLIYLPGGMTFEEYFGMEGLSDAHQMVNLTLGLTPSGLHRNYLVDRTRLNLAAKIAPSTMIGCNLCAGVAATEALKILLCRGKAYPMPHYHLFDAYANRYIRGKCIGGARNPLFRLKAWIGHRQIDRMRRVTLAEPTTPLTTPLMRILDMARWTPSGDNAQPWRFEILDESRILLHLLASSETTLNIRHSEPILICLGMMLEIMAIAAEKEGKILNWTHLNEKMENGRDYRFEITFQDSHKIIDNPLYPFIPLRHTDRRRYRTTPLTILEKQALENALGGTLAVSWRQSWKERWRSARLNMLAFVIRMKSESAYHELAERLDWEHSFSEDKLPVATLPMNSLSRHIMRWAMGNWRRIKMLGKIPGALLPSAVELELLPALHCGAHFTLTRKASLESENRIPTLIAEGRALIRFWLTASRLGLAMQPGYSPLVFAYYSQYPEQLPPQDRYLIPQCRDMAGQLKTVTGYEPERIVFLGRLGRSSIQAIPSRSLRKRMEDLITSHA